MTKIFIKNKFLYLCVLFAVGSTPTLLASADATSMPAMSPRLTRGFAQISLPDQDNESAIATKYETLEQDSKTDRPIAARRSPIQRFRAQQQASQYREEKMPPLLTDKELAKLFKKHPRFLENRESETYIRPLNHHIIDSLDHLNDYYYEFDPENCKLIIKNCLHAIKQVYDNVMQITECSDPEKPSRKLIINRTVGYPYKPFFILSDGSKDSSSGGIERIITHFEPIMIDSKEDVPQDRDDIFELEPERISPESTEFAITPEPTLPARSFDITQYNHFANAPNFITTQSFETPIQFSEETFPSSNERNENEISG